MWDRKAAASSSGRKVRAERLVERVAKRGSHDKKGARPIADLAGHRDSTITASIYRHNLAPVIRRNPTVITAQSAISETVDL